MTINGNGKLIDVTDTDTDAVPSTARTHSAVHVRSSEGGKRGEGERGNAGVSLLAVRRQLVGLLRFRFSFFFFSFRRLTQFPLKLFHLVVKRMKLLLG